MKFLALATLLLSFNLMAETTVEAVGNRVIITSVASVGKKFLSASCSKAKKEAKEEAEEECFRNGYKKCKQVSINTHIESGLYGFVASHYDYKNCVAVVKYHAEM